MSTLIEALYNALLFAGDKKSGSGGQIKFVVLTDTVVVMAHDDFTFIQDEFPRPAGLPDGGALFFSKETVAAVLKGEQELQDRVEEQPVDAEGFMDGATLLNEANSGLTPLLGGLTLSPDRWRKLALLKPQGNPLDIRFARDQGHPYLAFKCGPTLRGILATLDRDVVKEELGSDYLW